MTLSRVSLLAHERGLDGVLLATTGALRYIRMRGGGPELADDDAAGTGDRVSSVALSRFSGVMTLAPTSNEQATGPRCGAPR